MLYETILLCGVVLNQVLLTQHQALVSESCKNQYCANTDAMVAVRKLRMEFESYRGETQQELQQLKEQLKTGKIERTLELQGCPADDEAGANDITIQLNSSNSEFYTA